MPDLPDLPFECPAKWERSILSHSPGRVVLTAHRLEFCPGTLSVVRRPVEVAVSNIARVVRGDNFLWRGVVKVDLRGGFEGRQRLVFFLGGKRREFMERCGKHGIEVG